MTIFFRILWQEAKSLFVDDGALAALLLIVIACVAGAIALALISPLLGGIGLLAGYLLVLTESLYRFTRTPRQ